MGSMRHPGGKAGWIKLTCHDNSELQSRLRDERHRQTTGRCKTAMSHSVNTRQNYLTRLWHQNWAKVLKTCLFKNTKTLKHWAADTLYLNSPEPPLSLSLSHFLSLPLSHTYTHAQNISTKCNRTKSLQIPIWIFPLEHDIQITSTNKKLLYKIMTNVESTQKWLAEHVEASTPKVISTMRYSLLLVSLLVMESKLKQKKQTDNKNRTTTENRLYQILNTSNIRPKSRQNSIIT